MSDLPFIWTCEDCDAVVRTSHFEAPVDVQMVVSRCPDPGCGGSMWLTIEGVDTALSAPAEHEEQR